MSRFLRSCARLPFPWAVRRLFLVAGGCDIHRDAFVERTATLVGDGIRLDEGAYLNRDVFIDSHGGVHLGKRVAIGPRASILAFNHALGGADGRAGTMSPGTITIGDGAWIGAHTVIFGDAEVGAGAVVGASSVVRGVLEGNAVYAGAPARRLRELPG